ncbi:hypothetical protein KBY97_03455 [Synechococcus sp. ATX 2A4]|uniref:ElyC/SanA/YdcF family protein n=1 Tax=Synechococcus sp. ATX 2A4 TaxID=2823727 RepID=UPI0020CE3F68|nr:ElyC/SanA/YdcF family protein [Synechococcus sp. ATX 2A4]MCP9884186.1 hypothetical protein [Synechococcus sp. ATX 2A4]
MRPPRRQRRGWRVGLLTLGAAVLWWQWPWLRPALLPARGDAAIAVLAEDPVRLEHALDLWEQRPGTWLVILASTALHDAARRQLQARRPEPAALRRVVKIPDGLDTVGQMIALHAWTRRQPVRELTLVTGEEHLPRARALAAIPLGAAGIAVSGSAARTGGFREDPMRRWRDVARLQLWRASGWDGRTGGPNWAEPAR